MGLHIISLYNWKMSQYRHYIIQKDVKWYLLIAGDTESTAVPDLFQRAKRRI